MVEWGRGLNEFGRGGEGGRKREGLFSPSSIRYRHTLTLSSFLLLQSGSGHYHPRPTRLLLERDRFHGIENSMEFSYTYRIYRALYKPSYVCLEKCIMPHVYCAEKFVELSPAAVYFGFHPAFVCSSSRPPRFCPRDPSIHSCGFRALLLPWVPAAPLVVVVERGKSFDWPNHVSKCIIISSFPFERRRL